MQWQSIKENSGFVFDEDLGVPTSPDHVWDDLIKGLQNKDARAQAKQFRHTPLANLEESESLFQGNFATGSYARSGSHLPNAFEPAGVTRSPGPDELDDGSLSQPPLRREHERAETHLRSRNNETYSVSRRRAMPARLEDYHPRNKVHLPSPPRHRKRSRTNGAVLLADALDRVIAVMSTSPAPSVQLPEV